MLNIISILEKAFIDLLKINYVLSGRTPDKHDILQIAATSGKSDFSCFIKPTRPIPAEASAVHGLTFVGSQLYLRGMPEESVTLDQGIKSFISYLKAQEKKVVLVAHKLSFDLPFTYNAVKKLSLIKEFDDCVAGGICTLLMANRVFKNVDAAPINSKLATLAMHFFGPDFNFAAHDARGDTDALAKIFRELSQLAEPSAYSITLEFFKERCIVADRFATLQHLLKEDKNISKPFLEVKIRLTYY